VVARLGLVPCRRGRPARRRPAVYHGRPRGRYRHGPAVATAYDQQWLMLAEAIGRPLALTVMRSGAPVEVIAEPAELVAA
jgi:hypothetical protein